MVPIASGANYGSDTRSPSEGRSRVVEKVLPLSFEETYEFVDMSLRGQVVKSQVRSCQQSI